MVLLMWMIPRLRRSCVGREETTDPTIVIVRNESKCFYSLMKMFSMNWILDDDDSVRPHYYYLWAKTFRFCPFLSQSLVSLCVTGKVYQLWYSVPSGHRTYGDVALQVFMVLFLPALQEVCLSGSHGISMYISIVFNNCYIAFLSIY